MTRPGLRGRKVSSSWAATVASRRPRTARRRRWGVRQQRRLQCYCPGIGEVEQRSGEGLAGQTNESPGGLKVWSLRTR